MQLLYIAMSTQYASPKQQFDIIYTHPLSRNSVILEQNGCKIYDRTNLYIQLFITLCNTYEPLQTTSTIRFPPSPPQKKIKKIAQLLHLCRIGDTAPLNDALPPPLLYRGWIQPRYSLEGEYPSFLQGTLGLDTLYWHH